MHTYKVSVRLTDGTRYTVTGIEAGCIEQAIEMATYTLVDEWSIISVVRRGE